jgi:ribosomal-protein-alanine N-acetyltransferase
MNVPRPGDGALIGSMRRPSCRWADRNDLQFISGLADRLFSRYGEYGEILAKWSACPGVITMIIADKETPLGFAMLGFERHACLEPAGGQLLAIAVVPEYHRRGIGTSLLSQIETVARKNRLAAISLCTAQDNAQARSFFENAGYTTLGFQSHYYPRGQPAVVMSKTLER